MASNNNKMNKLKGIFSRNQKENTNPADGKRNLYFDYERKISMKFVLDVATTCQSILKNHQNDILNQLKVINISNSNLKNYAFLIVELKANKYDETHNLINVKLRMDDNVIYRVLMNSQLMLCYLLINKQNIKLKKNMRIYGFLNPLNLIKNETQEKEENIIEEKKDDKKKEEKKVHIYYPKNVVFYCQGMTFGKDKIQISEEELTIFSKTSYKLLIKDIKSTQIFLNTEENSSKLYLNEYKIYGDRPSSCIEIKSKDNKYLLLGKNNINSFNILSRALDAAIVNYKNHCSHFYLINELNKEQNDLYSIFNAIMEKNSLDNILINKDKRKILFKNCKEKELVEVINNIIEFKYNLIKGKFNDVIINIKKIFFNTTKIIKEKKFQTLINFENLNEIENIWNKINNICSLNEKNSENSDNNKIENTNNNIEEKIIEGMQDSLQQNISKDSDDSQEKNSVNTHIKLTEEKINELKEIININVFDNLFLEIKQKYISEYYNQNNNKNETINSNFKLILGNYFTKNFDMKEKDTIYLGGDEFEKTIESFNVALINGRKGTCFYN